ncbi:uncharacterized protein LOC111004972 [Momordica charantia]|uniref:Uncharacterized protein LOC111004972 n=1 Tax=Momordica charantia TaxID=3673 RepID=A0A6J1BV09_MOMCH|nr:uncharacterized protein LOC111004972 [Momordica charantia]
MASYSSSTSSSSIDETLRTDRIEEDDDREVGVSSYSSCGCFFGFGSRQARSSDGVRCRYLPLQPHEDQVKQSWMMKKVKRFKEIIKAVAGRKWRSFISGIISKKRSVRFQYDPRSYALNFDEGSGEDGGGSGRHGFRAPSATPIGLGIGMNRSQV